MSRAPRRSLSALSGSHRERRSSDEAGMDKGGCCWQGKPDLLPAGSARMGAPARLVSDTHTLMPALCSVPSLLQGLVTRWRLNVKTQVLTHIQREKDLLVC